jgi:hypothetical protein
VTVALEAPNIVLKIKFTQNVQKHKNLTPNVKNTPKRRAKKTLHSWRFAFGLFAASKYLCLISCLFKFPHISTLFKMVEEDEKDEIRFRLPKPAASWFEKLSRKGWLLFFLYGEGR